MSEDESFWAPRQYLFDPIQEIYDAARLLDLAVEAHLSGDRSRVAKRIQEADIPAVGRWLNSVWGKQDPKIIRFRAIAGAPAKAPSSNRKNDRVLPATKKALQERDGHLCRFCGIPLVSAEVRDAMRAAYPPPALRWGDKDIEKHVAFQCLWLQYDHVLPHQRGGDSSLDNLVITCAACNYGRWYYTLEEVGVIDPRSRPVVRTGWDGLQRFLKSA
jgi:5-methylcytosine-specific restriction endonuclease McrA